MKKFIAIWYIVVTAGTGMMYQGIYDATNVNHKQIYACLFWGFYAALTVAAYCFVKMVDKAIPNEFDYNG